MDKRLTTSQIKCASTCLRKHWYAYVKGIRPVGTAKPLRMGSMYHAGLDKAMYAGSSAGILYVAHQYDETIRQTPEWEESLRLEKEIVTRLLAGYFWRWEEQDQELQYIASEVPFQVALKNPKTGKASRRFKRAGKIDKLIQLHDGRYALMEHKLVADDLSPESDYWLRLRIDTQISAYMQAARQMGYDVDTCIYDVTRKPTIRPVQVPLLDDDGYKIVVDVETEERVYLDSGKPRQSADKAKGWVLLTETQSVEDFGQRLTQDIGERPEWYYQRREIPRLPEEMAEAEWTWYQWDRILGDCDKDSRWPRNDGACTFMGRCPYLDLCAGHWQEGDTLPERYYVADSVHLELDEEEES